MTASPMYRIFKRAEAAASVRSVVVAMVLVAVLLTAIGIVRVTRQHEVLALGLQLSKESEHVRQLEEVRRRLELEHATLTAPDRIRKLATELGMTPVAPDRIRILENHKKVASRP
ncbi:MAG TPA: cell division protein FtsL [Kofleriaceae bacterium]|nr:cell division protein FtsL [Kofleriaceae bacterium]